MSLLINKTKVSNENNTNGDNFQHKVKIIVNNSISFSEAKSWLVYYIRIMTLVQELFREWYRDHSLSPATSTFVTCGLWDLRTALPRQCLYSGVEIPHSCTGEFVNIKYSFQAHTGKYAKVKYSALSFAGLHLVFV